MAAGMEWPAAGHAAALLRAGERASRSTSKKLEEWEEGGGSGTHEIAAIDLAASPRAGG